MTTEEKRKEVIRRRVTSVIYDAEHSSSYEAEIYRLIESGDPVEQWDESELDTYLREHDENGNAIDPPDEDEEDTESEEET